MPIVVLFYQENGLGMHEVFQLKAIYSIAMVAMEIPSGWMADVWGRKKTLLAGSVLGATGFLIYSFAHGFAAFVAAEIILGIGYSFVSGADAAMLYDSLKAVDKSKDYVKVEGRITSVGNFAEALAGVAGGFLAAISLRMPFYFQVAIAAMAIPAAMFLTEPTLIEKGPIHSISKLTKNIAKTLLTNHNLRIAILLSSLTGTATLTFAWLVQPFFKAVNLPVEMFGVFWTALNITVGASSVFAYNIERAFGKRTTLIFIITMLAAGYIFSGIAVSYWGIAFLFLFYLVRGIATPVLKNYINLYTQSEVRATMLSVRNFAIRVVFAAIGPLLGWITDNKGLNVAFISAGLGYLFSTIIIVFPWLKTHNEKKPGDFRKIN